MSMLINEYVDQEHIVAFLIVVCNTSRTIYLQVSSYAKRCIPRTILAKSPKYAIYAPAMKEVCYNFSCCINLCLYA